MFSARFFKAGGKHGQPGAMSRFQFDTGTSATAEPKLVSMENHYDYEVLMLEAGAEKICTAHLNPCCETEAANESLV